MNTFLIILLIYFVIILLCFRFGALYDKYYTLNHKGKNKFLDKDELARHHDKGWCDIFLKCSFIPIINVIFLCYLCFIYIKNYFTFIGFEKSEILYIRIFGKDVKLQNPLIEFWNFWVLNKK